MDSKNKLGSVSGNSGFTLFELLVSSTLTALVVLILALAFHSGVRAYHKGKLQNEHLIKLSSLESLMRTQLMNAVGRNRMRIRNFCLFKGAEQEIHFVTTTGPLSSQAGGLLEVGYRFLAHENLFVYGQRIVTRAEDIKHEMPSITENQGEFFLKNGWYLAVIPGVTHLEFRFSNDKELNPDVDKWTAVWDKKHSLPQAVAFKLGVGQDEEDTGPKRMWQFVRLEAFASRGPR